MQAPSSLPDTTADLAADSGLRAAAIVDDGSCDVDELLAACVRRQQQRGRRVRGLLMTYPGADNSCAGDMVLVDIDQGHGYPVSQSLGSASTSCRADPAGFARAGQVLRRACDESPDLVVSNRFGGLEASGGGFRDELLHVLSLELPLLTVVSGRHLAAWQSFTGGTTLLRPDAAAVDAWIDATLRA